MRVREFQDAVWNLDHLRLVIKAEDDETVGDFNLERAAGKAETLTKYLQARIEPRINGLPYIVIDGSGERPNGNTKLDKIRQSYK